MNTPKTWDGRKLFPWQCSNCHAVTMFPAITPEGYANYVQCPACKGKGTKHYDRQAIPIHD